MTGWAIPLFWLIAGAIWTFIRLTRPQERQSALEWFLIAVFVAGGIGLLFQIATGGSITPTAVP